MKREIKFRAYSEQYGMSEPFTLTDYRIKWLWSDGDFRYSILRDQLTDELIVQFTGLHDRESKEIFEGDIVDLPGWSPSRFVVDYSSENGCFYFRHRPVKGNYDECHQMRYLNGKATVIGNIYQHPELISGKEGI